MKKVKLIELAVIASLLLPGCTRPYFKTFNIDESAPTIISIDARQRLVIVTDKGGPAQDKRVICAEPSLDVFTAMAVSGRADVPIGREEVGVQAAMAQN